MIIGILWALAAGLMLGLYALPGKYTRDFKFENTWGLFFILTMFVVPIAATLLLMKDVGGVFSQLATGTLVVMCVSSFAWGTGVMMWGKAITHIGLSLGFSLFIGTVILIGSILPIFINLFNKGTEGLPPTGSLALVLVGIVVVLLGIVSNGKAGLIREKDEAATSGDEPPAKPDHVELDEATDAPAPEAKVSMALGIFIAVFGGLLATGFNVAFTVGGPPLADAVRMHGNPDWMSALAVMFPVFLSGGVVMSLYFIWQLTQKQAWGGFKTPAFAVNFVLIFIMAFFHYTASAAYAYAGNLLGDLGPVVGYAIFNTTCVVVAILSGIVTGEWARASAKAKNSLYVGLACMVIGIAILATGNLIAAQSEDTAVPDAAQDATRQIEQQLDNAADTATDLMEGMNE